MHTIECTNVWWRAGTWKDSRVIHTLLDALYKKCTTAGSGLELAQDGDILELKYTVSRSTYTYLYMMLTLAATLKVGSYITFVNEQDALIRIICGPRPRVVINERHYLIGTIVEPLCYGEGS